jgi:hypothetical protein
MESRRRATCRRRSDPLSIHPYTALCAAPNLIEIKFLSSDRKTQGFPGFFMREIKFIKKFQDRRCERHEIADHYPAGTCFSPASCAKFEALREGRAAGGFEPAGAVSAASALSSW